jgi:hypothetical protein
VRRVRRVYRVRGGRDTERMIKMAFADILRKRNPELFPAQVAQPPAVAEGAPSVPPVPPAVQALATNIEAFLPIVENLTGLSRREIALQLLKTGLRGGNILSVVEGLLGQKPQPEAKIIRYLKVGAIWVPIGIFLMGLSCVGIYIFAKLMIHMLAGL